jgi:hypothetical protein
LILTRIESFRALKFSNQESFGALKFSCRILDIRVRQFLNLESFRAPKLSNVYALLSPERKFLAHMSGTVLEVRGVKRRRKEKKLQ